MFYSHKLLHSKTTLVFLKGKNVNDEIDEAKKKWNFDNIILQSKSDLRGKILVIKNLSLIKL